MKKIILLAILAVVSFTAKAQDTKPYEEKMAKLESAFKELEDAYHSFSKRDPATFTDAEKAQLNQIMAKADSLDSVQTATALEIAEKFKATKFPARYLADVMYNLEYDQLKQLCDPSTGYYNEPGMEKVKKLVASPRTDVQRAYYGGS